MKPISYVYYVLPKEVTLRYYERLGRDLEAKCQLQHVKVRPLRRLRREVTALV